MQHYCVAKRADREGTMSTSEDPQVLSEKLTQIGMTDSEKRIWRSLIEVFDSMYELPPLHKAKYEETYRALHDLQTALLERPGLRALGWPLPATDDEINNQRENLIKLGMTQAELEVWYAPVAGTLMGLPELYPMEREETAHAIHKLQTRLLARPVFRASGWESPTPDAPPYLRGPEVISSSLISKDGLTALGMIDDEVQAWEELADLANRIYQLPSVYLWERRETQHDLHNLELRLLARPSLRRNN
jgi:hypothetical protein